MSGTGQDGLCFTAHTPPYSSGALHEQLPNMPAPNLLFPMSPGAFPKDQNIPYGDFGWMGTGTDLSMPRVTWAFWGCSCILLSPKLSNLCAAAPNQTPPPARQTWRYPTTAPSPPSSLLQRHSSISGREYQEQGQWAFSAITSRGRQRPPHSLSPGAFSILLPNPQIFSGKACFHETDRWTVGRKDRAFWGVCPLLMTVPMPSCCHKILILMVLLFLPRTREQTAFSFWPALGMTSAGTGIL